MVSRWQVGRALGRASWAVLKRERALLGLAALGLALVLVAALVLFVPLGALALSSSSNVPAIVGGVLFALAAAWLATFTSVAMTAGALRALDGQPVSAHACLAAAWERRTAVTWWAIASTTVGALVRVVERRVPVLGLLIGSFAGLVWAVATAFAIPVITLTGASPLAAVKQSVAVLRERWGESAGAVVRASLYVLPWFFGALLISLIVTAVYVPLGIALIVLTVVGMSLVGSVLSAVGSTAVYRYATAGTVPVGFAESMLSGAVRRRRRWFGRRSD